MHARLRPAHTQPCLPARRKHADPSTKHLRLLRQLPQPSPAAPGPAHTARPESNTHSRSAKKTAAPDTKLLVRIDSAASREPPLLGATNDAYEFDSCDEMRRAPSDAQTDLISRLKDKVRSQAARLLDLETCTPARSPSVQDPAGQPEELNQLLEAENAQLRKQLSEMKEELLELQRQVSSEQEEASCKLQELHELANDLQAVLKQECYKNEKLTAYVEVLSRIAEDKLCDAKPGSPSSKPELHSAMLKMKQVFEENYSLRSANHKLTGEMTDSLENFKQRSQELKSQLKDYLGKRSKTDEQLIEAEKKLQETQCEVSRAQRGLQTGATRQEARRRDADRCQEVRLPRQAQLEPAADTGSTQDGPRPAGRRRAVGGVQLVLVASADQPRAGVHRALGGSIHGREVTTAPGAGGAVREGTAVVLHGVDAQLERAAAEPVGCS